MGSAASKPARSAAGAATRQYPKKPAPPPRTPAAAPKKTQEPKPTSVPAFTPQARTPAPAPAPAPASAQGPKYHSKEQPSSTKSNAIDLDGRDPDFAASLRTIGPVDPSGNFSHPNPFNRGTAQTVFPTASNPALLVITARQRITKAAQEESIAVGDGDFTGRQFLDSFTISQALAMRDQQGLSSREIERTLRLKSGIIEKLGRSGIVSRAS